MLKLSSPCTLLIACPCSCNPAQSVFAALFAHRCIANAYLRTSQGNYSLNGLVGFEMYKKTVGVIGTGAIGYEAVRILKVSFIVLLE